MRKSGGFTMVELMITVIVIGIMVTIAIPNYARSVERGRCSFAMNMLKSIRSAAILYFRENQTFSTMNLADLEDLAGAKFYSDNSHLDWRFELNGVGANTFIVSATRLRGPHAGNSISMTAEDSLLGSTYPYENPGQF